VSSVAFNPGLCRTATKILVPNPENVGDETSHRPLTDARSRPLSQGFRHLTIQDGKNMLRPGRIGRACGEPAPARGKPGCTQHKAVHSRCGPLTGPRGTRVCHRLPATCRLRRDVPEGHALARFISTRKSSDRSLQVWPMSQSRLKRQQRAQQGLRRCSLNVGKADKQWSGTHPTPYFRDRASVTPFSYTEDPFRRRK